jgi:pilus assembly protein CpaF
LLAGDNLDRRFVASTVAACVDLVVFCRRANGRRTLTEILAVAPQVGDGDEPTAGAVFRTEHGRLQWTGEVPYDRDRFREQDIDLVEVLR